MPINRSIREQRILLPEEDDLLSRLPPSSGCALRRRGAKCRRLLDFSGVGTWSAPARRSLMIASKAGRARGRSPRAAMQPILKRS